MTSVERMLEYTELSQVSGEGTYNFLLGGCSRGTAQSIGVTQPDVTEAGGRTCGRRARRHQHASRPCCLRLPPQRPRALAAEPPRKNSADAFNPEPCTAPPGAPAPQGGRQGPPARLACQRRHHLLRRLGLLPPGPPASPAPPVLLITRRLLVRRGRADGQREEQPDAHAVQADIRGSGHDIFGRSGHVVGGAGRAAAPAGDHPPGPGGSAGHGDAGLWCALGLSIVQRLGAYSSRTRRSIRIGMKPLVLRMESAGIIPVSCSPFSLLQAGDTHTPRTHIHTHRTHAHTYTHTPYTHTHTPHKNTTKHLCAPPPRSCSAAPCAQTLTPGTATRTRVSRGATAPRQRALRRLAPLQKAARVPWPPPRWNHRPPFVAASLRKSELPNLMKLRPGFCLEPPLLSSHPSRRTPHLHMPPNTLPPHTYTHTHIYKYIYTLMPSRPTDFPSSMHRRPVGGSWRRSAEAGHQRGGRPGRPHVRGGRQPQRRPEAALLPGQVGSGDGVYIGGSAYWVANEKGGSLFHAARCCRCRLFCEGRWRGRVAPPAAHAL